MAHCMSSLPQTSAFFWGGGGAPATPSWRSPLIKRREISRNRGSELSNATIVRQGDAVADITRREDELNLIPGNAVETATPEGIPVCHWSTRKPEGLKKKSSGVACTEKAVSKKEISIVVKKVIVHHGPRSTVITTWCCTHHICACLFRETKRQWTHKFNQRRQPGGSTHQQPGRLDASLGCAARRCNHSVFDHALASVHYARQGRLRFVLLGVLLFPLLLLEFLDDSTCPMHFFWFGSIKMASQFAPSHCTSTAHSQYF